MKPVYGRERSWFRYPDSALFNLQMVSERQRIEGAPPPVIENSMPPPPAYEEVNGIFMRTPTVAELVETVEHFLAEVTKYCILMMTSLELTTNLFNVLSFFLTAMYPNFTFRLSSRTELRVKLSSTCQVVIT
jgi:hypothetical protein